MCPFVRGSLIEPSTRSTTAKTAHSRTSRTSRTSRASRTRASRTRAIAHLRAHSCTRALAHRDSRTRALAHRDPRHSRTWTAPKAALPHGRFHWAVRIASRPIGPSQVRGSQGPSHMGRLPGSCLACARLACKAACMRIRRSMRAQPWLSCQATGRNRHAGSPSTSVSRVTQQPRRGGDFSSLAHHSRRRRSIEAAFSSLVQSSSCSSLLID